MLYDFAGAGQSRSGQDDPMQVIRDDVLERLDLTAALVREIADSPPELPLPLTDLAVHDHIEPVARWIAARAQSGGPLTEQTVVGVRKARHGFRPASAMPL